MNSKNFEFQNKDVPFLKRDILFRFLFLGLFAAVFIWQFASLITKIATKSSVSVVMIIASAFVLLFSLLFCFISIMYAIKSVKTINVIKNKGRCISSVTFIFSTKKASFVKLYSIINQILTIITALILISSVTYNLLKLAFYGSISFYMPCLAAICLCGFNSIYHLDHEVKVMNNVEEFNKVY